MLDNPTYASRLAGVKLTFGDQAHPAVARQIGEHRSSKKTNAFNKSNKEAREWASSRR